MRSGGAASLLTRSRGFRKHSAWLRPGPATGLARNSQLGYPRVEAHVEDAVVAPPLAFSWLSRDRVALNARSSSRSQCKRCVGRFEERLAPRRPLGFAQMVNERKLPCSVPAPAETEGQVVVRSRSRLDGSLDLGHLLQGALDSRREGVDSPTRMACSRARYKCWAAR